MASAPLLVDPEVSHAKLERELALYRASEAEHRRRGWWMLDAQYPEVFVVFATPQIRPAVVAFGAMLNFENYDLLPPSVRLVDPFTRLPYKYRELPVHLPQLVQTQATSEGEVQAEAGQAVQNLIQAHNPDDVPFLWRVGVREYHEHPVHTGDSWLLHGGRGEGTLYRLLEVLYRYGVQTIAGFQVGLLQGAMPG